MKYQPGLLDPFISPVSGQLRSASLLPSLNEDYTFIGNAQNVVIESPILIDIRLELIRLKSLLGTTEFIIQTKIDELYNAQVLDQLATGFLYNTEGILSIQIPGSGNLALPEGKVFVGNSNNVAIAQPTINFDNLPDIAQTNLITGDSSGRPVQILVLPLDNSPNLTNQQIWRGNSSNRPEESNALTTAESNISQALTDLANLASIVSSIASTVSTLSAAVASIEAGIASIGGFAAILLLQAQVLGLIGAVASLGTRVSNLENTVADIQAQITDIYTQLASINTQIIDLGTRIDNLRLNTIPADGDVSFYGFKLINLANPVNPTDGVNLQTMEAAISGAIDDISLDGFVDGNADETGLIHTTRGVDCVLNVIPATADVSLDNFAITDLETLEFSSWSDMEDKAQNALNFLFFWQFFGGGVS